MVGCTQAPDAAPGGTIPPGVGGAGVVADTGGVAAAAGSAGVPVAGLGGGVGGSGGGQAGAAGPAQAGVGGALAEDGGMPDAHAGLPADASAGDADASMSLPALPLGARAMFPLPGATGLCDDPPLRIGFDAPPTLGSRGRVQVWNDAQDGTPVVSIDLGASVRGEDRGGVTFQQPPAAYLDGNAAVFPLPPGALARGQRYHVTIDDGVLRGPDGPLVIDEVATWRFETALEAPADTTHLSVGLHGGASFCSVQGAVEAVPAGNQTATTIEIGEGSYFGVVYWTGKDRLTVRGANREATRIVGTNNNNLNPSTRTRALFGVDDSADLLIQNLTIENLTPQGGSQAEALRLQRCDRCVVRDADILSLQDTLLWSGRLYAENCLIAGNVDFVWGTGAAFFDHCEIRTVGRAGYVVQARNSATGYGYVFVDSRITSEPGITGAVLARIDASQYPSSHVAYIDCEIGSHITPAGWTVTGGFGSSLRFWEYGSKDAAGNPISVVARAPSSRQLSASEASSMRDPAVVLGGWSP